jgi:amino acid adenylation domain-containing protein
LNIGEIFFQSARKWNHRPALVIGDTSWTYGELADFAQCISGAIETHHSQTGICALWSTRELSSYVGLLGILIGGEAYMPLHPKAPPLRNAQILGVDINLLLTGSSHLEAVKQVLKNVDHPCTVIAIGDPAKAPQDWPSRHKLVSVSLERPSRSEWSVSPSRSPLAYVLFTSGSSGDPKGVGIRHDQIISYLKQISSQLTVKPEDRISQFFDLTFDLSVHDLFVAWRNGACLFVLSETDRLFPSRFINEHKLSVWFSVPSIISPLRRTGLGADQWPSLLLSLFCGETLHQVDAQAWLKAAPNSELINLYGPTEATIAVSTHKVSRSATPPNGHAPIGKIFPEVHYRILPDSNVGELCLSGAQVIEKYFAAHDPNKFFSSEGKTWYRTGDLVRAENDGLYFVGRTDTQIKIRGYRIELGEIELAVSKIFAGAKSAALEWPRPPASAERIYVFVESERLDESEIIAKCRTHLPDYMVPTKIFSLQAMPINTNGKTDRIQLAAQLAQLV